MSSLAGVLGVLADTQFPDTVFAFLLNASGALMVFVYMMTTFAQIRLRRERERTGAPAPAVQMWLFPWTSYAAIAGMIAVLIAMARSDLARDLYASLGTLVVAIVAYLLVRAGRGAAVRSPAS
jgi:GABA permease